MKILKIDDYRKYGKSQNIKFIKFYKISSKYSNLVFVFDN